MTSMSPMILLVGTCPMLTDDKISTKSLLGCSSIDEKKKKKEKKNLHGILKIILIFNFKILK